MYEEDAIVPVTPNPALNFNWLILPLSSKKSSFDISQPTETAGKLPHLLFSPKVDEPSRRIEAIAIYFSLKLYVARAKNPANFHSLL